MDLILAVVTFFVGIAVGTLMMTDVSVFHHDLIEAGCGMYHPQTGDFTLGIVGTM